MPETVDCSLCGKCSRVCPTQAVDYFQQPEKFVIKAKTAVLATGFKLTDPAQKKEYGQGQVDNVITSMQMERLLADRKRQLGDSFNLQAFHDRLMAAGRLPLSLVRWDMTGLDDEVRQFWPRVPMPEGLRDSGG